MTKKMKPKTLKNQSTLVILLIGIIFSMIGMILIKAASEWLVCFFGLAFGCFGEQQMRCVKLGNPIELS